MAIAICEGARIPRGVNHHFPHFKAIYHGHGATSYQNVQIQNYGSVPIPNNYVEHIDDHHSSGHSSHGSISISNNYVEHIHEHHPSEHLTHVSIPFEHNYVEGVHEHHQSEHLHSNGKIKLVTAIILLKNKKINISNFFLTQDSTKFKL